MHFLKCRQRRRGERKELSLSLTHTHYLPLILLNTLFSLSLSHTHTHTLTHTHTNTHTHTHFQISHLFLFPTSHLIFKLCCVISVKFGFSSHFQYLTYVWATFCHSPSYFFDECVYWICIRIFHPKWGALLD